MVSAVFHSPGDAALAMAAPRAVDVGSAATRPSAFPAKAAREPWDWRAALGRVLPPLVGMALLIGLWAMATQKGGAFPTPAATFAEAWKLLRDRCRVKRFWGSEADEVGHILHRPGGTWAFHYDIRGDAKHDDAGYHFDTHKLAPGEYISLKEQDGVLRTFFVRSVVAVD